MLTREKLKEVYSYNPKTGAFINRSNGSVGQSKTTNGYIRIWINGKHYSAHRLAFLYMTGTMPSIDIDHINHNRTDNRWDNFRIVSRQENMRNAKLSSASTSGFTGVVWDKENNKWAAQIMINGKSKKLGRFFCKIDAIAERIRANKRYGFHENHGKPYA